MASKACYGSLTFFLLTAAFLPRPVFGYRISEILSHCAKWPQNVSSLLQFFTKLITAILKYHPFRVPIVWLHYAIGCVIQKGRCNTLKYKWIWSPSKALGSAQSSLFKDILVRKKINLDFRHLKMALPMDKLFICKIAQIMPKQLQMSFFWIIYFIYLFITGGTKQNKTKQIVMQHSRLDLIHTPERGSIQKTYLKLLKIVLMKSSKRFSFSLLCKGINA